MPLTSGVEPNHRERRRFGVVGPNQPVLIVSNESMTGGWRFNGTGRAMNELVAGLELAPVLTANKDAMTAFACATWTEMAAAS